MKLLLLAVFVAVVAVRAVSQAPTQSAPQGNTGVVEGTIMTTTTPPEPISGVTVQLNIAQAAPVAGAGANSNVLEATTDDMGHFAFKDLYPGRYALRYQRDGYFPAPGESAVQIRSAVNTQQANGRGARAATSATVAAQPTTTTQFVLDAKQPVVFSIQMLPGGVISGRVFGANGRPVINGQVAALQVAYQDGSRDLTSVKTTGTNDRGEYRLYGLQAGEYYVSSDFGTGANGLGAFQNGRGAQQQGMFRVYFPGVVDVDRAQRISVAAGSESSGTNFTVQTSSTVKISGIVVNRIPGMAAANAAPPGGALSTDQALAQALAAPNFLLAPRDSSTVRDNTLIVQNTISTSVDRAQGKFELAGIRPGHYELYAVVRETTATNTVQHAGHISVDVGTQDVSGITITIQPVGEVRVRFTGNGDAAIQSQTPTSVQMRFRAAVAQGLRNAPQATQPQRGGNTDGWHVYSPLMEGPYVLDSPLASLRDAYVADIRQGDKSIYETGTIMVSGTTDPVEIVLARPAGSINGTVQNAAAKPVAGIQVVLIPNGSLRENFLLYKRGVTAADGQFTLTTLAPGEYKLFAWESLPSGAELNAEFMKDYEDRGVPITVQAGTPLKVQLPLIPSGK